MAHVSQHRHGRPQPVRHDRLAPGWPREASPADRSAARARRASALATQALGPRHSPVARREPPDGLGTHDANGGAPRRHWRRRHQRRYLQLGLRRLLHAVGGAWPPHCDRARGGRQRLRAEGGAQGRPRRLRGLGQGAARLAQLPDDELGLLELSANAHGRSLEVVRYSAYDARVRPLAAAPQCESAGRMDQWSWV